MILDLLRKLSLRKSAPLIPCSNPHVYLDTRWFCARDRPGSFDVRKSSPASLFLFLIFALPTQANWIPDLEIELKWQWAAGGDARVIPGRDVLVRENIELDVGGVPEAPRNLDSFFVGFNLKWGLGDITQTNASLRAALSPGRDYIPSTLSRSWRGEGLEDFSFLHMSDAMLKKIRIIKLKKLYGALGYEMDAIVDGNVADKSLSAAVGRSGYREAV